MEPSSGRSANIFATSPRRRLRGWVQLSEAELAYCESYAEVARLVVAASSNGIPAILPGGLDGVDRDFVDAIIDEHSRPLRNGRRLSWPAAARRVYRRKVERDARQAALVAMVRDDVKRHALAASRVPMAQRRPSCRSQLTGGRPRARRAVRPSRAGPDDSSGEDGPAGGPAARRERVQPLHTDALAAGGRA
ncbi:MAG TPA: hypothetical protein VF712_10785 [Thermoleophilaceae bacterium]|jgi:hypothetical protein